MAGWPVAGCAWWCTAAFSMCLSPASCCPEWLGECQAPGDVQPPHLTNLSHAHVSSNDKVTTFNRSAGPPRLSLWEHSSACVLNCMQPAIHIHSQHAVHRHQALAPSAHLHGQQSLIQSRQHLSCTHPDVKGLLLQAVLKHTPLRCHGNIVDNHLQPTQGHHKGSSDTPSHTPAHHVARELSRLESSWNCCCAVRSTGIHQWVCCRHALFLPRRCLFGWVALCSTPSRASTAGPWPHLVACDGLWPCSRLDLLVLQA